jgi:hypothetical protein
MFRIVCRGLSVSSRRRMDPIQAIFVNKIRSYAEQSAAIGGPVGVDAGYDQEIADIKERLSRTYGGGDMDSFPVLEFAAPDLNQDAIDGERTIDIQVQL